MEMTEEIRQQLLELIRNGKLGKAIGDLTAMNVKGHAGREIDAIASQYSRVQSDQRMGLLSMQEYHLMINQVVARLIGLLENLEKKPARRPFLLRWWKYIAFYLTLEGFESKLREIVGFEPSAQARPKQLGGILVGITIMVGGAIVASNWLLSKELKMGPVEPSQTLLSYVGIVTDSEGRPQNNLTASLRSGRIAAVKTNQNGILNFGEYSSEEILLDTLELFRNGICVYRDAIRFPSHERIVLNGKYIGIYSKTEGFFFDPPSVDSCKLKARELDSPIVLTGEIYAEPELPEIQESITGIAKIHVFVVRKGCNSSIAETWTDADGRYALTIPKGSPFPDKIVLDGTMCGFEKITEPFKANLPDFNYSLKKKR